MAEYVIAIKRDKRDQALNLEAVLSGISGLVVKGSTSTRRVRVEATPEAITEARARLSDVCHIEAVIEHRPS